MKKFVAIIVLALSSLAAAQTTPNINLNVPLFGTQNWNLVMNANFQALDLLLSGNAPLPSLVINGTLQTGSGFGGQFTIGQVMASGTAPACTFTSGGGTSPSCTLDTGSTNLAGSMILTTGTGSPGGSGTLTLTFAASPFGTNRPICVFRPSNLGAGTWNGLVGFVDQSNSTASDVTNFYNGTTPTALTASTTYWVDYICVAK